MSAAERGEWRIPTATPHYTLSNVLQTGGTCMGGAQPLWIWAKASESESGIESDPSECCSACVRKVAANAPIRQPARKVASAIRGTPTDETYRTSAMMVDSGWMQVRMLCGGKTHTA